MAGLGETIGRLSRLKRQFANPLDGPTDGGRMVEEARFGPNPGALRMLSYTPDVLPARAPLVVVLHGCTQRAEAHASAAGWLTLADRYGFAVLAPEQVAANNPNRCFNWFEPGDASRDAGEAASIRAMVAHLVKREGLDPDRVFVTGLSAGGAMTAVLLAAYPDVFSAGAVIAGLPFGTARNVGEAMARMQSPQPASGRELAALVRNASSRGDRTARLSVWHGDQDFTVNHRNGADLARQWAAAHQLGDRPDTVETAPGRVRSTWRGPDGRSLVELHLVHGLGHGTPLASGGPDGIGAPAPYMLEAGVSSTLEIARFWGLTGETGPFDLQPIAGFVAADPGSASTHPGLGIGDNVMSAVSGHVDADVQAVIARALKSAGLM